MPLEISARPLDAEQLAELAGVLRDDAEISARLSAAAGNPAYRLWVGIFNARPVSIALVESLESSAVLRELVVHPATRGRGVGTDTLRLAARQQPFSCPANLAELAKRAGLSVS